VLEQLEKVEGVQAAMANHSGSLVRISLVDGASSRDVSMALGKILIDQKRKPKPLSGDELAKAIRDEQWRSAENIGELSEIEFRTVFAQRVKEYAEANGFDETTKTKLIGISRQVLDETAPSNKETDWVDFRNGLATRMLEKAKDILSDEQLGELAKKLKSRVIG
jgi:hypothetical protein